MIWEWWLNISFNQKLTVFTVVPFFLFLVDLLVKNGFKLSIRSAGGDLCLAAIGIDISQAFMAMSEPIQNFNLSSLFLVLALVHIFLWISCLRLISLERSYIRTNSILDYLCIGTSYFMGIFAFFIAISTILQFLNN